MQNLKLYRYSVKSEVCVILQVDYLRRMFF